MTAPGILFVISAPSGTGKTTVAERLLAALPGLGFSVSHTTRAARAGERDGADYHFVSRERFAAMVAGGEFLEWAEVFGERYGTGVEATRRELDLGRDMLLDIDVQGARQVRSSALPAVLVMLLPPDFETLTRRLAGRHSETPETQGRRLERARREVEAFGDFDYVVVNDEIDATVATLVGIVRAERRRSTRCAAEVGRIVQTFPPAGVEHT